MDELRFIPINTEDSDPGVFVQGIHVPARLVEESGVWIREAGSAILTQDQYQIAPFYHTLWLVADEGDMTMTFGNQRLCFKKGECFVIPAGTTDCRLEEARDSRLLWFTVDGALATSFLRQMNAHNLVPARQGILPNQVLLIRQIVQVLVRHSGTDQASFQLAQLLWALLAAHSGHSVATNAVLSHEIARVVDAMRQSQYQANFSLAEMAAISRMPMETFRKRFTTELGIPPAGLPAVPEDGACQDPAAGRHERAPDRRGDRYARPLPFLQAVQAHRGHEPHRLPQARGPHGARRPGLTGENRKEPFISAQAFAQKGLRIFLAVLY